MSPTNHSRELAELLDTMPMEVADRVIACLDGDTGDDLAIPSAQDAEVLARWMQDAAARAFMSDSSPGARALREVRDRLGSLPDGDGGGRDAEPLASHRGVAEVCQAAGLTGWDGGWQSGRVRVFAPRGPNDEDRDVTVEVDGDDVAALTLDSPRGVLAATLRALGSVDTPGPDGEQRRIAAERVRRYNEIADRDGKPDAMGCGYPNHGAPLYRSDLAALVAGAGTGHRQEGDPNLAHRAPIDPSRLAYPSETSTLLLCHHDGRRGGTVTVGDSRLGAVNVWAILERGGNPEDVHRIYPWCSVEDAAVLDRLRRDVQARDGDDDQPVSERPAAVRGDIVVEFIGGPDDRWHPWAVRSGEPAAAEVVRTLLPRVHAVRVHRGECGGQEPGTRPPTAEEIAHAVEDAISADHESFMHGGGYGGTEAIARDAAQRVIDLWPDSDPLTEDTTRESGAET